MRKVFSGCIRLVSAVIICCAGFPQHLEARDVQEDASGPIYNIVIHDLPASFSPLYPPFQAWLKNHPRVRPSRYSKLNIKTIQRGSLMMAIAGGSAPDLLRVYHHEARSWIRNGFFEPLDRYIYEDTDGNGEYSHGIDKVIWKPFLNVPDRVRDFMMYKGHIYIIPRMQWIQHFVFRKDIFAEAGINPDKRIETFDELIYVCRKLTDPDAKIPGARNPKGRHGFGIWPNGWIWQGWLYACGGQSMYTDKTCPECGTKNVFGQDEVEWQCSRCGSSLKDVPGRERAELDSPEAERALSIWKEMLWAPFIPCPECGEPVELGSADAELTYPLDAECSRCGKKFQVLSEDKVIFGCARRCVDNDSNWRELWRNGEIAITNYYKLDWLVDSQVNPTVVGVMPYPEKGGASAFHYYGIYSGARNRRGGQDRVDVCAEMILDFGEQFYVPKDDPDYLKYEKEYARRLVNYGYYNLCSYDALVAAGLEEYAREISPADRKMQKMVHDLAYYKFLPISEGYTRVQQEILTFVLLSRICTDRKYDIRKNLRTANELADTQVFMKDDIVREKVEKYKYPVIILLTLFVVLSVYFFYRKVIKGSGELQKMRGEARISFGKRFVSILLLLPAVLLILMWAYYPLLRGSIMAFEDVKVLGESKFVGLENFIRVVTNPLFPTVIKATLIYVTAILSLGFFTPVFLAILLSEAGRGSTVYRLIYYAPHLLGGVVVLFIWKIFYMPTSEGLLNHFLEFFNLGPVRWLENPSINKWAMAIPSIWAGSGSACLVYLAALKSIDDEIYEAADIDGAGTFHKIFHITIPSLKPLLIINFVGAFIGAFHNMGNILVLTGGAFETNVIGLQIFFEAFGYLRFGSATALAWILGSLLIGFTIYQLNFLRKVEFRRAQ